MYNTNSAVRLYVEAVKQSWNTMEYDGIPCQGKKAWVGNVCHCQCCSLAS